MAFESLILDARGNPYQGSLDAIGGETLTDARVAGATLGALSADVLMDINGKASAVFEIRAAAMNATLVFEGTVDGTNYYTLPAFVDDTETQTAAVIITTTHAVRYDVASTGWRRVRCRVSAYTSGNCVVTGRASEAAIIIYNKPIPATLHQTATASNAIATATLPAAGAGMFHYITAIHMMRASTAAVVGTAVLTHTSTNLPGNPAWTVGNAIAVGGQINDFDYEPSNPLKSSTANTATTIVMPAAGVGVSNRINVSYYIGA